jgi:hypothetical protein
MSNPTRYSVSSSSQGCLANPIFVSDCSINGAADEKKIPLSGVLQM